MKLIRIKSKIDLYFYKLLNTPSKQLRVMTAEKRVPKVILKEMADEYYELVNHQVRYFLNNLVGRTYIGSGEYY